MRELKVKPFLIYSVPKRIEGMSWRPWGGIQTEEDMKKEVRRIEVELNEIESKARFPLEFLPISSISSNSEIKYEEISSSDVILIYAAGGPSSLLERLTSFDKPVIIFLRYKTGPVYLWYEIIHPRFLRKHTDEIVRSNVGIEDIVVDDYEDVLWKLRALYGLKNTIGHRIIAVGGPAGWETPDAPYLARKIWKFDIVDYSYPKLGEKIEEAKNNEYVVKSAEKEMEKLIGQSNVILKTQREFVINSLILYKIFKDLLEEFDATAITINECMGTIINYAKTTACLPLSIFNDEGYMAFCESDFVAIPAGILLHYISEGKPVFLNDPTTPYNGKVTLAHCTSPRKMDGENYEPTQIVTHFESDYGAAPKVNFRKGQEITVIDPDFSAKKWIAFRAKITDTPFLNICRSQMEVEIEGNWEKLLNDMRGFHWIVCYGDYLKEVEYALKKVGIEPETI